MCQGLLTCVIGVSTGSQGSRPQQCVKAEVVGVSPAEPGGPVWMRAESPAPVWAWAPRLASSRGCSLTAAPGLSIRFPSGPA